MTQIEFYRNNIDLQDENGIFVEAGSIFYRKDNKMILVDEDAYAEFKCNIEFFSFEGYDLVEIKDED